VVQSNTAITRNNGTKTFGFDTPLEIILLNGSLGRHGQQDGENENKEKDKKQSKRETYGEAALKESLGTKT
jgi:hypothetical protein